MSSGSREFLSVEEIRERIRNRVRELADTASPRYGTSMDLDKESAALALHRLNKLRLNLQNANSALNDIGAINPRPAGWTNQVAQVLKKCMRRGLGWLLRPVQQFDSAVMGSLNEITHILGDFQAELRSIVNRFDANEVPHHPESNVHIRSATNGSDPYVGINARIDILQSHVEALTRDIQELMKNRTLKS